MGVTAHKYHWIDINRQERLWQAVKSGSMHKTIDGIRLAYDDAGSGQALVLLHGFPLDRSIWDAQFESLAQSCRVVRIDLRGSGGSGLGEGPALMEALAGDVFGLLDALGIERAIVAGHSMGGYVALAFFRMYAERVAGLALIASQVGAESAERRRGREVQIEAIGAAGMEPLANTIVAGMFASNFATAQPRTLERVGATVAGHDPVGAVAQLAGMKERLDSADLLEDITVPTLIVGGANDRLIAPAVLESTAAALVDCECLVLPNVAHMPMLEAADATTAALERLLARCAISAAANQDNARATPA